MKKTKTLKLETFCGDTISTVIENAKSFSKANRNQVVEFDFNGCTVFVNDATNVDSLLRDYHNHWYLNTKVIGSYAKRKLNTKAAAKLAETKLKSEQESAKRSAEYARKQKQQQTALDQEIEGVTFEIKSGMEKDYQEWIAKNSNDGYSKCVVDYVDVWARLMQAREGVVDIAKQASCDADVGGITGFMYGCAVGALAKFWVHGDILKRWHNGEYDQPDAEGVVNPAA